MVGGNLLGKMTARCKLIIGAQNFLRETVMSLILSIICGMLLIQRCHRDRGNMHANDN